MISALEVGHIYVDDHKIHLKGEFFTGLEEISSDILLDLDAGSLWGILRKERPVMLCYTLSNPVIITILQSYHPCCKRYKMIEDQFMFFLDNLCGLELEPTKVVWQKEGF